MRRLIPLFLLAMFAAPSAAQAKVHWLDTYEPVTKGFVGPKRTEKLDKKDPYVAIVRGTFSFFERAAYRGPYCGITEPAPTYRSRGTKNGRVNSDVEFLFADMGHNCSRRNNNPITAQTFEIAVGRKYKDYDPFGVGELTAPRANHAYRYALIGRGKRAGFRLYESFGKDNYGRIRIRIRRARSGDCTKGFASFGYADVTTCQAAVAGARAS